MAMLDLDALVAASRAFAMGGSRPEGDVQQLRLADVAAHLRSLMAAIQQRQQQQRAGGSAREEDAEDPEQAAQQQELLLCFRVMRNAAAAGEAGAEAVLQAGLLELAGGAVDLLACAAIQLDWQLPAALAQALANLCNAAAPSAAAAWASFFPLRFAMLAHVNAGPTQGAICLALLACCRTVEGAAAALAGQQGSQMMTALLCNHQRMLQQGQHNDTLGLLVAHLCFQRDLLPQLFGSLGAADPEGSASSGISRKDAVGGPAATAAAGLVLQPTMAQAALLELLCSEAHDMPQAALASAAAQGLQRDSSNNSSRGGSHGRVAASMSFLVEVAQQLAAASKTGGTLSSGQQQVLQEALHLVRDICARDDSGRGLAATTTVTGGAGEGPDLVEELRAAGALPQLLAMLKALEPIQNPQQQRQQEAAAVAGQGAAGTGVEASTGTDSGNSGGFRNVELAPQLATAAARYPSAPPYPGFRSDLLAALANAAHGRPAVQTEVGSLGGVELVLAQCQLDRQSPLAREWALWGVRNLCEGNPAAQNSIRQLKLCTTVESKELQQLGVKLELDEKSGKLRVTQRDPRPAMAAGADTRGSNAAPAGQGNSVRLPR